MHSIWSRVFRKSGGRIAHYGAPFVVTGCLCVARLAHAAETNASKPYIDASLGAGVSNGLNSIGATGFAAELSGPSVAFTLGIMPAYAFSREFALGVGVDAVLLQGISRDAGAGLLSASAVAVLRNEKGFEGAFAVGAEALAFHGQVCVDYYCTYNGSTAIGPRFGTRGGYVWRSGFGVALNASMAVLVDGQSTYTPGVLVVQGTFSSW